jgi:hypothetical protein
MQETRTHWGLLDSPILQARTTTIGKKKISSSPSYEELMMGVTWGLWLAGSCWAFATIGAMEGINAIKTGQLLSLSVQELIDCDRNYNQGCDGGFMDYAFEFIVVNGGIDTETDYPYSSSDGYCDEAKVVSIIIIIPFLPSFLPSFCHQSRAGHA